MEKTELTEPQRVRRNAVAVLALAVLSLFPMFLPDLFVPDPGRGGLPAALGWLIVVLLPAGAALLCLRWLPGDLPLPSRAALVLFFLLLTGLMTDLHATFVGDFDIGFRPRTNLEWQQDLHVAVLESSTDWFPHTYRFLPNSFTRIIEWLCGDFEFARLIYRWIFGLFLVFAIYRYSRLFVGHVRALTAVLLCVVIYPVTIRFYAGQLADPMSHLSFVLAFIALEIGVFPYFLLALLIGSLAKESVLALLGVYVLFYRDKPVFSWGRFLFVSAAGFAVLLGARIWVMGRAAFEYYNISGVEVSHIVSNFMLYPKWSRSVLFSVGLLAPFVVLGWRRADPSLRRLILFLTPVLFVSSTMFGFIYEARNYVPVLVPMAIIAADYLIGMFGRSGPDPPAGDRSIP